MKTLINNTVSIYGDKGKVWLNELPSQIKRISQHYQLTELQPMDNLSFNYVAHALQQGNSVVLKLGIDHNALNKEAICLKHFSNYGSVTLIDAGQGMIFMQKATPGTALKSYFPSQDNQSITILCDLLKRLHQAPIPQSFGAYSLEKLLTTLDDDLNIPQKILTQAREKRDRLIETTKNKVLLHGDLHHDNILLHQNQWLAIDPKGFIGDPIFDVCAFIHNPFELLENNQAQSMIHHRIITCADQLGANPNRVSDWLYVKTILCWAWCLNDNLSPAYFQRFSELLDEKNKKQHL